MTKLQCSAIHCEYNSDNRCCRPDIQVGGGSQAKTKDETCCDSFRKRNANATNKADYCHPDNHLNVACTAVACEYNNAGQCVAKAIQIGDASACRSGETECHTFIRG